jgi:hypothetical protein
MLTAREPVSILFDVNEDLRAIREGAGGAAEAR